MKKPFITRFTKTIFLAILIFYSLDCNSQVQAQKQKSEFWSHVSFGGGIGLSFGNNFFSGTLAPSGIYNFNEKFAAGVGLNMSYSTEKNFYESYILGTSFLGFYNVFPQLQLSAEFEQLYVNREFEDWTGEPKQSYWYPGLYIGAGFNTGPVTMGIRVDVLYDSARSIYVSPYNPFVRFYF